MKVTLRQLQVFDAVAAAGTVTGAARSLNMSQSAASSALNDLQIVLGRQLFVNAKGRALQITDEGRRLQPVIRSVLSQIHEVEAPNQEVELAGTLLVGSTAMIAETVLPPLCIAFMARHPRVRIRLHAEGVGELFDKLSRYELETALIEIVPEMEGIELVTWQTDEMVLVAHPDHPLARRQGLRLGDLAGVRWCLRESYSSTTARLRYKLYEQIGQLNVTFEATSDWALRHAVIAGGGVGCLSRMIVQGDLDHGRLVALDIPEFRYRRALSLARPKHIWRSALARAFDSFLLEENGAAA
jgi:DNA-binding transcriptional LysR family regulator